MRWKEKAKDLVLIFVGLWLLLTILESAPAQSLPGIALVTKPFGHP